MSSCNKNSHNGPFSVDLLEKSRDHISFLKGLHSLGITIHRPSKKSLERYRDQWLPMINWYQKVASGQRLIPPPDIAWLFHCHRLAPFRYAAYCQKRFGFQNIPDVGAPFSFQSEIGEVHCGTPAESMDTRNLWKKLYPQEPFFLQAGDDEEEEKSSDFADSSLFLDGFDLLGSTGRQSSFLWHVSSHHFSDDEFLKLGIDRYHKFITLRKIILESKKKKQKGSSAASKHPSMIVPTYDIDLMWHTHILSGLALYHDDCKSILGGSTLNHDDGVGDRTEGGSLDTAFKQTKALWKDSYGEDYSTEGGMYKGEPPESYFSKDWESPFCSLEEFYAAVAAGESAHMHLIGIHGATSTNQVDPEAVWAWKETPSQMSKHKSGEILGKPEDCWIKYDSLSNDILEQAYLDDKCTKCDLGNGYKVNFVTWKQTKTSTGHMRDVKRHSLTKDEYILTKAASQQNWTRLGDYAPDGLAAFVPAEDRSKTRGVIVNKWKNKYVFGKHGKNVGYFHITTQEAYEVLVQRIMIRARKKENDIDFAKSCICSKYSKRDIPFLEEKLEELREVQLIAQKRAETKGPGHTVKVPKRLLKNKKHFKNDGSWNFPVAYYNAGGGCGFFTEGGAYCGGGLIGGGAGACGGDGGAACGAAGCGGGCGGGGGGCGGGGCGGGGCGGGCGG